MQAENTVIKPDQLAALEALREKLSGVKIHHAAPRNARAALNAIAHTQNLEKEN